MTDVMDGRAVSGDADADDAIVVIDDAHQLDAKTFEAITDSYNKPAVMRGLCSTTTAVRSWTLENLLAQERERVVAVEHYEGGDKRTPYVLTEMALGELAEAFARGEGDQWYLASQDLDETFPSVADELPRLPVVPAGARSLMRAVFFGVDTASATHFHTRDQAVLVQIHGAKRIILAEPAAPLATNAMFGSRPHYSTHGPLPGNDAAAHFDELLNGNAHVVDLAAGDALFIPVHWWHWVESRGESLSVTSFWRASYRHWVFPQPGYRALVAVATSQVADLVRRPVSMLRRWSSSNS